MAPFARRRAQICVPAAFMRKVKRLKKSFARRLAVPVTPATFAVLPGRLGRPSAAGKSIRTCTGRPRTQLIYRRQSSAARRSPPRVQRRRRPPLPTRVQESCLVILQCSVSGLRDFAKRRGPRALRRLRRLRRRWRRTLARLQYAIAATTSPRRRRATTTTRGARRRKLLTSRIKLNELPMAAGTAALARETGAASLMAGHKRHQYESPLLHK